MGHCVRLLIPTRNETEIAPLLGSMIGRWGGVTVLEGYGWWAGPDHKIVRDELSMMECAIGDWDTEAQEWWFDMASVAKSTWGEECVMLEVFDCRGYLVYGPDPDDRKEIGVE